MTLRGLGRFLLAAAFLAATQISLVHPLEHLWDGVGAPHSHAGGGTAHEEHPLEPLHAQQCEVCVAAASLGSAAPLNVAWAISLPARGHAQSAGAHLFFAAFSPLFRSQAPPALL